MNTYRDDRLEASERAHEVSTIARRLLKDPLRHLPMLVFSGIASIIAIMLFIYAAAAGFQVSLNFYAILVPPGGAFLYHLVQIIDISRYNSSVVDQAL